MLRIKYNFSHLKTELILETFNEVWQVTDAITTFVKMQRNSCRNLLCKYRSRPN